MVTLCVMKVVAKQTGFFFMYQNHIFFIRRLNQIRPFLMTLIIKAFAPPPPITLIFVEVGDFFNHSILTWPKKMFLDKYYFHRRVCVCVSVLVCVSV